MILSPRVILPKLFVALVLGLLLETGWTGQYCHAQPSLLLQPSGTIGTSSDNLILGAFGVAFLSDDRTLVADKLEYQVKCIDRNLKNIAAFGKRGKGNGEFRGPGPIASSGEHIAVADLSSNRIQIFSTSYRHLSTFYVDTPVFDVAFDAFGRLWIGKLPNQQGQTLFRYDLQGNIQKAIVPAYAANDEFYDIFKMTARNDGTMVLAYLVQNAVEIWDSSGTMVSAFSVAGLPAKPELKKISRGFFSPDLVVPRDNIFWGVASDAMGRVFLLADFYTEHPGRDIYVVSSHGRIEGRLVLPAPSQGIFINPHGDLFSIEENRTLIRIYKVRI